MSQHMAALKRANVIRAARAQIKREIKAGELSASSILLEVDLPDCLSSCLPEELLGAVVRLPHNKILNWLGEIPCNPTRSLGEMTYRQRAKLGRVVKEWEQRPQKNSSGRRTRIHGASKPGARRAEGRKAELLA